MSSRKEEFEIHSDDLTYMELIKGMPLKDKIAKANEHLDIIEEEFAVIFDTIKKRNLYNGQSTRTDRNY